MKIVVYTCITGNYDKLEKYNQQFDETVDFVCFTDNKYPSSTYNGWIIKPIPDDLKGLSNVKTQRMVKILPHKYLSEYDISVWVDGNINVLCDVKQFVEGLDFEKNHFFTRKHPQRNCIYKEATAVIACRKDVRKNVNPQIEGYRKQGFPENYGLAETCIIIRKHNEKDCQLLCNTWAKEVVEKSHRDQLSFDYVRWVCKINIGYLNTKRLDIDENFRWRRHG